MKRYTVHFSGRVQGVGFRYTTTRIAANHPAAGVVENLPDGRVRLVIEGEPGHLDALVDAILVRMAGYVKDHTIDRSDPSGEFGLPEPGGVVVRH